MDLAFLSLPFLGKPAWFWLGFLVIVIVLMALDLGVFNKGAKKPTVVQSTLATLFYAGCAALFGVFIWHEMSAEKALEFFTGYIMEMSLSLDNVFVMSLIFSSFSIPVAHQHRVLFWGILSVLILRGLMIGVGAALIANFAWVLTVFGIFLLFTGIKVFFSNVHAQEIDDNRLLQWMRKHIRITKELHGSKFLVWMSKNPNGKKLLWVTPLFVVLVLIEVADVVFAVDSVPAIFAVTQDPYIVYTSNIFAILGLRSLYFALAAMVGRFTYLSKAIALVLVYIGGKIIYAQVTHNHVPIEYSLGIVLLLLVGGVGISLIKTQKNPKAAR
jgi:tellurite resistance protein TerC